MKKMILALTALLFKGSAAVKAQVETRTVVRSTISGGKKGEIVNIDNAKYRITYEAKWVNNTSIKPFIYTDSEMRLDIGEKVTNFYDRTKQVKDSLMQEKVKTGNFDFSDLPKGGRFPFSYYKNYPTAGKSIQLESVGTTDYQCTENVETPDWQLIPDSTADIIGYHCQLAKTQFKGTFARRTMEVDRIARVDSESIRRKQGIYIHCRGHEYIEDSISHHDFQEQERRD